jgi:hypothetical protein
MTGSERTAGPRNSTQPTTAAERMPSWLLREFVGTLFEPLLRGALWLFMHLLLAIKIAFVKVFLS